MVFENVGNNILTLFILGGVGWIIYDTIKGNDTFANMKDKIGRFTKGGNNNGRFGRNR